MFSPRRPATTASLVAVIAIPAIASAQSTDPTDEPIEEITVVGTHIEGVDIEGALPVTVLSFEDIEATGAIDGDELLRAIPQFGSIGMGHSRGGITGVNAARGDVASFNLRSIGDGNTLVLINAGAWSCIRSLRPAVSTACRLHPRTPTRCPSPH